MSFCLIVGVGGLCDIQPLPFRLCRSTPVGQAAHKFLSAPPSNFCRTDEPPVCKSLCPLIQRICTVGADFQLRTAGCSHLSQPCIRVGPKRSTTKHQAAAMRLDSGEIARC